VLVQKSVTTITNLAGRLSIWMLGKSAQIGKWRSTKSWQMICNQSNAASARKAGQATAGRGAGMTMDNLRRGT
jgi:hypothetical protein